MPAPPIIACYDEPGICYEEPDRCYNGFVCVDGKLCPIIPLMLEDITPSAVVLTDITQIQKIVLEDLDPDVESDLKDILLTRVIVLEDSTPIQKRILEDIKVRLSEMQSIAIEDTVTVSVELTDVRLSEMQQIEVSDMTDVQERVLEDIVSSVIIIEDTTEKQIIVLQC